MEQAEYEGVEEIHCKRTGCLADPWEEEHILDHVGGQHEPEGIAGPHGDSRVRRDDEARAI